VAKADLLLHQRIDYDDGAIVEMVLWQLMVDFWSDVRALRGGK
jgi:hypothetical protein